MIELFEQLTLGGDQGTPLVPALIATGLMLLTGYFLARQVVKWTFPILRSRSLRPSGNGPGDTAGTHGASLSSRSRHE